MGFIADEQTLCDLDMLDSYNSASNFSFFNQVKTKGGEKILREMFAKPLSGEREISARSDLLKHIQKMDLEFPVDPQKLVLAEDFLHGLQRKTWLGSVVQVCRIEYSRMIRHQEFDLFLDGLQVTMTILREVDDFFEVVLDKGSGKSYEAGMRQFREYYHSVRFRKVSLAVGKNNISTGMLIEAEVLIGRRFHEHFLSLLDLLYQFDVWIAVGRVAKMNGLNHASCLSRAENKLEIRNLRYPGLKDAVGNDILLDRQKNVLFLTGDPMAGKTTLMRSVGVAVYLAHMGFPVAAAAMTFSVLDGVFSVMDLPGGSKEEIGQFDLEVRRVKVAARAVAASKHLLVLFDELFKSTNIEDAFEATVAVTDAFADYRASLFIIATHIPGVAYELAGRLENLRFARLRTITAEHFLGYTYRLGRGISQERHGMKIIDTEGILDILGGGIFSRGDERLPSDQAG